MKTKIYFVVIAFPEEEQAKRFLEKSNIKGHVLKEGFRLDKLKMKVKK
jgi:hypothetical protein